MASLWEYANPVKFLRISEKVLPGLWVLSVLCLGVGLVWGFFFTPDDYRQGSTVKIIYLHVPAAFMAINAWLMMLVASLEATTPSQKCLIRYAQCIHLSSVTGHVQNFCLRQPQINMRRD